MSQNPQVSDLKEPPATPASRSLTRRNQREKAERSLELENAVMVELNKQIITENEKLAMLGEELIIPQKMQKRYKGSVTNTPAYLANLDHLAIRLDQHKQRLEELEQRYKTNLTTGLAPIEALTRAGRRGPNIVTISPVTSNLVRLSDFLFSSTNALLIAAIISLVLGYILSMNRTESDLWLIIPLFFTIVLNICASFYGAARSNKMKPAARSYKGLTNHSVSVIRAGQQVRIKATLLVSGDIVVLNAGDHVPADIRIIDAIGEVTVDQSILTGDKLPVRRSASETSPSAFESENMLFLGSVVLSGKCKGLVLHCGNKSTIAKLCHQIRENQGFESQIKLDLGFFYKVSVGLAVLLATIFSIAGMWSANEAGSNFSGTEIFGLAFQIAASVAIAAVPLLFNSIVVAGLGISEIRLREKDVFLNSLDLVNSLASINILAIGTKSVVINENDRRIAGVWVNDITVSAPANLDQDSILPEQIREVHEMPSPMQDFVKALALTLHGDARKAKDDILIADWLNRKGASLDLHAKPVLEPVTGIIRTNHPDNTNVKFVRGSPECIYDLTQSDQNVNQKQKFDTVLAEAQSLGHTVIGLGLVGDTFKRFLGLFAITNPVAESTKKAIATLTQMGIDLVPLFDTSEGPDDKKFIESLLLRSGLNLAVPRKSEPSSLADPRSATPQIAMQEEGVISTERPPINPIAETEGSEFELDEEAYLDDPEGSCLVPKSIIKSLTSETGSPFFQSALSRSDAVFAIDGRQLDLMTALKLRDTVGSKNPSFYNVSFLQKLRVVLQLKRRKLSTVGFIGELTSDAPALRAAQIGFGTSYDRIVAQVSDAQVTTPQVLSAIAEGVIEARRGIANLRKSLIFLISQLIPRLVPVLLSLSNAFPLPLTTKEIVVGSLLLDLPPALGLLFEPAEYDVHVRRPRNQFREKLISEKIIIISFGFFGLFATLSAFLGFNQAMSDYGFNPSGLIGFGNSAVVLFDHPSATLPGFPLTTGYPMNLGIDRFNDIHLCGRVGQYVASPTNATLREIAIEHRCNGPIFTLDLFNQYCYSLTNVTVYSTAVQDAISLYQDQKDVGGVIFARNSTNNGQPVCGTRDKDGVYIPFGFYTNQNQPVIDKAMQNYQCSTGQTVGADGLPICFTAQVVEYAQTVYFTSYKFFALALPVLFLRTGIFSFFQVGAVRENWWVLVGSITSLLILLLIIYVPAINTILGTKQLDVSNLFTSSMPFVCLAFILEEVRKLVLRRDTSNGRWLMHRTMW